MKIVLFFFLLICFNASAEQHTQFNSLSLESKVDSVSQTEFLRRNSNVKTIAWSNTGKIYIYLKNGEAENYALNDKEEVEKAESKYGTLPKQRRPFPFKEKYPPYLGGDVYALMSMEVSPEYPGGKAAMDNYLKKNISASKKQGFSGIATVSFVIEKDGSLTNVKVERGINNTIDAELVRVLESSVKWSPGIKNGNPVRCSYTLQVRI